MSYPDNWPEVSRRRQRYGATQRMDDEPTRLQRQKFAQTASEVHFDETGLSFADAIERVRQGSGLNIVVMWPVLELYGVTRDQQVSMPPLSNVTWRKILELILQQAGATLGGAMQLDWAIDGGVLTISTREDLVRHLAVRVYDVGDLLIPPLTVSQPGGIGPSGAVANSANTGTGGGISGTASSLGRP